jgi:aryl-alcohol dehydrogenase-like predicted oxidoreductase
MDNDHLFLSRKEFLKKASAAVVGIGLAVQASAESHQENKKTLGRTGLRINPIGFGATRTMEQTLLQAAMDAGVNFFDTGRWYFNGQNENMVGKALSGRRKEAIIQSKVEFNIRQGSSSEISAADAKRIAQEMARSLEDSLKALQTDYIDILLIHNATSPTLAHHETMKEFFTAAKKSGKIRAHGFSSHMNHVEMVRAAAREKFFDVLMVPYNHKGAYVHSNSSLRGEWHQEELETELKKAGDLGIGLIAMKTCSGGPCPPKDGGKPDFVNALRWILERNRVHGMAVAMADFDQLQENLTAL